VFVAAVVLAQSPPIRQMMPPATLAVVRPATPKTTAGTSLQDLRHTPEGRIIADVLRMSDSIDRGQIAALQMAAASQWQWGRDALKLAVRSGLIAARNEDGLILLLTGMLGLSAENCRYFLPFLIKAASRGTLWPPC
jgi:hypothetical protein